MLALTTHGHTEHLPEDDKEDAMRRFWEAKQGGDASARLVRIDDVEPANGPMPDDDPPPAAPAAAGRVSEVAELRIAEQSAWLTKEGFALAPPLFAPGTRVLPLGDRNFRIERRRVEHLPRFGDVAHDVAVTVAEEHRVDRISALGSVSLTEEGTLLVDGKEHALEVGAFFQLAQHAGFGMGARYLTDRCDAKLRATNVNIQFAKTKKRLLTFRTRDDEEGRPTIYATVTPTYTAVDTDAVLAAVAPKLGDTRVEALYDGTGVRATALWMPDQVVDLAAGDIFKTGVRVESDDTGRGRVRISAVVWRNRCLNLLIIGEGVVETVAKVHRGDPARILVAVSEGVEAARGKVGHFLEAWGHARTLKTDPERLIRAWIEDKELVVPGERDTDATVEALLAAWRKEPGDTYADAVNAVSRAAHENPLWGVNIREELERQAAKLVFTPR